MRILILGGASSRNAGGVFPITTKLALALQQIQGAEVHILLHDDEYSLSDRVHFEDLNLHIYSVVGPKNFAFSPNALSKIRQINPDVIHIMGMWLYIGYANSSYHAETQTPYIISPQGMIDHWQLNQSFKKNITKRIALSLYERDSLEQANCIHALNQMEQNAIRSFGLTNPVVVIPNAADLPDRSPRPQRRPVPDWKQEGKKTLLFLGRIHTKKGLDNLLRGWAKTEPQHQDWQLVIAGETADMAYWSKLDHLREKLRIGSSCKFIGGQFDEDKHDCFTHADAFILPSFSEGLPVAVLEAWSYSLPVLMTPYCYLPEGFSEGAAIEIDTTPQSICVGITKLMQLKEAQMQEMGRNGLRIMHERFTWRKVADRFYEVYQWISGKRQALVRVDSHRSMTVEAAPATPEVVEQY